MTYAVQVCECIFLLSASFAVAALGLWALVRANKE